MTKRSAMAMAAGLATALIVGVMAISLTLGATPAANATGDRKPLIKHEVQTVTVHRKAGSSAPAGVRVVQLAPTTSPASMQSSSEDQAFDDQGVETEGAGDRSFDDSSSGGSAPTSQGTFGDD
jgi:hypothetical protein